MMSGEAIYEELLSAAAFEGDRAGLRIVATYEPAGGPGSRVFPPTYPQARPDAVKYLIESRRVDGIERDDVVLDGTASQANRAEEALLRARRSGEAEIPLLELHHDGEAPLVLTSLEFPHRYADAYLRDSEIDGVAFDKTDLGRSFRAASLVDARALFSQDPGSLVFGAWDSHRKGRQQKFPRIYSSEVIGWDPVLAKRSAGRMDPLNLTGAVKPGKDGSDREFVAASQKVKGERLSEIGHGNVAPNAQHGGVTISSAQRMATVSFAALDRIGFGDAPRPAAVAARAALAAYALLADRLAFAAPSLWLRSDCELVLMTERVEWIKRGGTGDALEVTPSLAVEVFALAAERAAKEGISFQTETVHLTPSTFLAKAIDFSQTKADAGTE
jgi:CRISPR-associated protein Csb1